MKKKSYLLLLFGLFFLAGCKTPEVMPEPTITPTVTVTPTPTITPTPTPSIPYEDDHLYAVAYLGWEESWDYSYFQEKYLGDAAVPKHYFSGGEYYLIIPRYENMTVKLYRNDLASMSKSLVYEKEGAEPFIIICNVSDIFPDVTVSLEYEGKVVEFTTYISLRDGSVEVGEYGLLLERE